NGGVMPFAAATAGGKTVHTLLSGPAAGAHAAAFLAWPIPSRFPPPPYGEGVEREGTGLRQGALPRHPDPLPAATAFPPPPPSGGGQEGGISTAQLSDQNRQQPVLIGGREKRTGGLVTLDMGGTSADIAFIDGGAPLEVTEGVIARRQVDVPALDLTTISAGGGSIAAVDGSGVLGMWPTRAG